MILVTAASGMFGSAVVRQLSAAGIPVRATSRDLDSLQTLAAPGVEQNADREFIITGPAAVTWSDAAAAASRALGRTITFNDMSRDDFRAMMISWGAFTDDNVDIGIMFHQDAFREGKAARVTDDFTTLTGRPATTIDEWWQQNAEHFLTPLKEGEVI